MTTRKLVLMALFIAMGIVLPIGFHLFGDVARVLSPMHIPVLIGGALLGPIEGLIIGVLTPLLSSLITGMPPVGMLPTMLVELAIYGVLTGYLCRVKKLNIFISLPVSMLIGRIGYGMVKLIMVGFKENLISIVSGMIIAGLPGIVLHLILVPLVVKALSNTGYIEEGSAK
ncbi:MAG: ECF transporter S component [Halanaerobiaceae bacterium]|nr:ECF transporter S component [Halanaerobiaceae bacterium]